MSKEQILNLSMELAKKQVALEVYEAIYNAGYNEGIEAVIPFATADYHVTAEELRRLKK